tara:strand:- start:1512 stop:1847 length:336 start_codon:yes stop_codon:yes gene_type:complete
MGLKLLKRGVVDGGFDRGFDGGFDRGFDGGFDRGIDGGFDRGIDRGFPLSVKYIGTSMSSLPSLRSCINLFNAVDFDDGFDGGVEFADELPISNIGFGEDIFLYLPNKRGI